MSHKSWAHLCCLSHSALASPSPSPTLFKATFVGCCNRLSVLRVFGMSKMHCKKKEEKVQNWKEKKCTSEMLSMSSSHPDAATYLCSIPWQHFLTDYRIGSALACFQTEFVNFLKNESISIYFQIWMRLMWTFPRWRGIEAKENFAKVKLGNA